VLYCKIEVKEVKKWVKWSVIGAGGLAAATLLMWGILLLFNYNLFALKGWHKDQYFDNMGNPLTGWQVIDGKTYYLTPKKATGWLQTESGRYYLDGQGNPVSGWYTDDVGTYLLTPEGKACTDWVQTEQGLRYFRADGRLATGTVDQSGVQLYFHANGAPCEGWLEGRYCIRGRVASGWQEIEGERYYFFSDGAVGEGWQNVNGKRYLCVEGKPSTGWYTENGDRYYLQSDGTMAVGQVEIDGETRFFTSTGKYVVLVNFQHAVPADYELNLIKVRGHLFDADAADELVALMNAAAAAGHPIYINNSYRSVATQQYMFNKRLYSYMAGGYDEDTATAIITESLMLPGHSEHHLGLAVDFTATNRSYQWLEENSWKYGFIVRYPEGKSDITGIIHEPWHFRYVGVELATELYYSGLCLEEYMAHISMSTEEGHEEYF